MRALWFSNIGAKLAGLRQISSNWGARLDFAGWKRRFDLSDAGKIFGFRLILALFRELTNHLVHEILLANYDADAADVVTVVVCAQRYRVLAGAHNGQINGESLALTVSNSVVRKDFAPGSTVDADIGALDSPGGIFNIEACPDSISRN